MALSTRCDPPSDIEFIGRAWSTPLDPTLREPPWGNNRAIANARRPWEWKQSFPIVAEASPELKRKLMEKWPHLFNRCVPAMNLNPSRMIRVFGIMPAWNFVPKRNKRRMFPLPSSRNAKV